MGVSIGVCVAMLPTIGFQMGLALVIAWVLRASRPAAILSVWLTNPLTMGPVYAFTYMVGRPFWFAHPEVSYAELCQTIQGSHHGWDATAVFTAFQNMFSLGSGLYVPMLVGGTAVGLVGGLLVYYPAKAIVTYYQRNRRRKPRRRASITQSTPCDVKTANRPETFRLSHGASRRKAA